MACHAATPAQDDEASYEMVTGIGNTKERRGEPSSGILGVRVRGSVPLRQIRLQRGRVVAARDEVAEVLVRERPAQRPQLSRAQVGQ